MPHDIRPDWAYSGLAAEQGSVTTALMKSFDDKVAAITGAGSGIGRALALELGRKNCHLALRVLPTAYQRVAVGYARFTAR